MWFVRLNNTDASLGNEQAPLLPILCFCTVVWHYSWEDANHCPLDPDRKQKTKIWVQPESNLVNQ